MHTEGVGLREPGFMLAVPLSGTSRRDPAPGALTRGPGGSAHVDSGGGAREPGAAQRARGPVPPPGRPLRPASCDPGEALPTGRLDAKLLLAWGGERRLPASQVAPRVRALLQPEHKQYRPPAPGNGPWDRRARNSDAGRGGPGRVHGNPLPDLGKRLGWEGVAGGHPNPPSDASAASAAI